MASSIRDTPALIARVDKLRDELIKRFQSLVSLATLDGAKMDRNSTAIAQYQMQVESAGLIRSAEDLQSLIRQLQEAWLFGQLNTMDDGKIQNQTDENARLVAGLLKQLSDRQQISSDDVVVVVDDDAMNED